jgi:hypothetical protein
MVHVGMQCLHVRFVMQAMHEATQTVVSMDHAPGPLGRQRPKRKVQSHGPHPEHTTIGSTLREP